MAVIRYKGDLPKGEMRQRTVVETMAKQFIEDNNLFKIKPDMRMFGFGDGSDIDNMWITIPDDLEVQPPIKKHNYPGGLYAACPDGFDAGKWVDNSDKYEWYGNHRAIGIEYFNPFNIYGLNDNGTETISYTTELFPIREMKKFTVEERASIHAKLNAFAEATAHFKPTEIDLSTMALQNKEGEICELNFPNGLLELTFGSGYHSNSVLTPQQFNYPMKIELRAKTNKSNLYLGCTKQIWMGLKERGHNLLGIVDETGGKWIYEPYKGYGDLPSNEFVDIVLILGKEEVILTVNGELRHYSTEYAYIQNFTENPKHSLQGMVFVGTGWGSTITVESLRITEI